MAELALAIIPLGLKICSGLVSYLGGLKDHNDALARLKRLVGSLEGSFRLLDSFLKSGQLYPSASQAAAYAVRCLANCEDGLKDLKEFGDKFAASNPPESTVKDKVKGTYRKLSYPLRQAQLTQLENALDILCTPLNLAVQGLQLELQAVTSDAMILNSASAQKTALEVSTLAATISGLASSVSIIRPQLPSLQTSVDSVTPQVNLMIKAHLDKQMSEIQASFQRAESAALQRHVQTAKLLSHLRVDGQNPTQAVCRLASRPSALYELASSACACPCSARRLRTQRTFRMGSLSFKDEAVSHQNHFKDCDFYVEANDCWRERTLRFTGLTGLIGRAVELTLRTTTGAGGFSISPSINYFAMVDEGSSPTFRVINLLVESRLGARWAMESYPGLLFESITRKLRSIFRSGRARPTDVNSRGYSLLHHLTLTMNSGDFRILTQQQRAHPSLKSLFDFLIAAGIPVSAVGSDGRLALHVAADEFLLPSSILARLCVDDAEIPAPRQPELRFGSFGRIDIANRGTTNGSACPCTEAVRILLEAKCPIRPFYDFSKRKIFGMVVSFNLFIGASRHCKVLIANQLQMRQLEFGGLTPRKLLRLGTYPSRATKFDTQSIELDDSHHRQAADKLKALPKVLPAQIGYMGAEKSILRPIWLDITCPEDASIFWHIGFTDIDDAWTHPSLSRQAFGEFGPDIPQVLHCTSPQYAMWLYNHCPNFWTVICEISRSECSSFILAEIIINNRKNLEKYLVRDPLAIEYTDNCTCQCSPEGYTPLAHSIRCLLERYSSDTDELRSFVEDFGKILTMYQHTAVLRQAVFADLDMVHTCSSRSDIPDESLSDRIYNATDDGDKAAFIDSVIADFRRFMLKDINVTDYAEESDDMYLFRETREYHERVLEFWDHVLPSMMGNFEQTLASTWNPDLEALKDIGVTLWIEEEKKQEVRARVYEVRRDDEETRRIAFKELMDKLEMIE
ncbi:hypothetical protein FAGAP_2559 [Fusarium agapanthi]|uniref:Fungal N-terminal domain-containing protein n=1 Tax=Fusarium agapanthi TaxID=1803897 RepID=A0A9P5EGY3_9HYPO|nr:hypothetical protein FAGAP_2559 [Fusarium agapanthi]